MAEIEPSFQHKISQSNSYLVMAMLFFVPISTSLSTLLALFILLGWIAEKNYAAKFQQILNNKLVLAIFAYVALHVLGLLWTDDFKWGLTMLQKQWQLLLLPFLLTVVKKEHYCHYFAAFISAMVFCSVVSFLVWLELIRIAGVLPSEPAPFMSRVVHNPLLAFAIYLMLHAIFTQKPPLKRLVVYIPLTLIMLGSMFITVGRTGQLVFLILIVLFLLQYFNNKILLGLLISSIVVPLIVVSAYQLSPNFRTRIEQTVDNYKNLNERPNRSINQRAIIAINSFEMVKQAPWLGVGTGDFKNEYVKINQTRTPLFPSTTHPHNQYLLVLAQFGVLGFIVFMLIFYSQIKHTLYSNDELQHIRVAFVVFFLTILWADAYLLGHAMTVFFVAMSSILYKTEERFE